MNHFFFSTIKEVCGDTESETPGGRAKLPEVNRICPGQTRPESTGDLERESRGPWEGWVRNERPERLEVRHEGLRPKREGYCGVIELKGRCTLQEGQGQKDRLNQIKCVVYGSKWRRRSKGMRDFGSIYPDGGKGELSIWTNNIVI